MSEQHPKQNISPTASDEIYPRQRIAQNILLIWLDPNIDGSKQNYQNTLGQLQDAINNVHLFTQRDDAIDLLTNFEDTKAFLVVEGTISQHIVPLIHDIPQLDTIYIICTNQSSHEQWTKKWLKIKGVHMKINSICEQLRMATKQYNQDSIAMSFASVVEDASTPNRNQLEPSFMYTQIFKEILLGMKYDQKATKDFVQFWRNHYINNIHTQKVIDEFESNYIPQSSITWYTRESFLYQMLNQALRTLEGDTIINMGFFICNLHHQIQELHQKQMGSYNDRPFTVYRGQGLSKSNFEKLLKSRGELMSFNNFLSTSKDRDISLLFAEGASTNTDTTGILFKMSIDPTISSTPFACIRDVSYFETEEEILFSMHTVFRIVEITRMDNNSSLYQVDLQLTADDDEQLRNLTARIQEEVKGGTGWIRFGNLLLKLGQVNKAEELYNVLLQQTSDQGEKAHYYHQLGCIKHRQGEHKKAIEYYEKSLEIHQKTLLPNHPLLATCYNNIASVYNNMGEYSKALSFYEKSLEIYQKTLPPNHPLLATSYSNIGSMYHNMGEYSKALSFYEKSLEIFEKTLPPNHPDLATSYNNIGGVYDNIGEYSKALLFHEKSLEICQKTLPRNHPDLATFNNNIAGVYGNTGEYSKALLFYEKSLEIDQKTLPPNHPNLATSYNNIAIVYYKMGEYSKALSFCERALDIRQRSLPSNHPSIQNVRKNIEVVKKKL